MKNSLKPSFLFLILVILSCGGGDDEPAIVPITEFTQDRRYIEPGETISFTNDSEDAESYSWDFGDNSSSRLENPEHTYTETGRFIVTLTSTSSTGDTSTRTRTVVVGNRWTVGILIESLPFTDSNGDPWDEDGSGPEFIFGFAPATANSITSFDFGTDFSQGMLPTGGSITENSQVMFTNETWQFLFLDNDPPLGTLENADLMFNFEINPVTFQSAKDYETGEGAFQINAEGFNFTIFFQIRE